MTAEMKTIIEFCLDHAGLVPMPQQVLLYRSLAEFCGDETDAALFRRMANEIDAACSTRAQLTLNLKSEKPSGNGETKP
jgi:hypothetical protein